MAPSCLPRSQRHAAVVLPPRVVQFHAHPLALREAGEAHKAHRAARRLGPSRRAADQETALKNPWNMWKIMVHGCEMKYLVTIMVLTSE